MFKKKNQYHFRQNFRYYVYKNHIIFAEKERLVLQELVKNELINEIYFESDIQELIIYDAEIIIYTWSEDIGGKFFRVNTNSLNLIYDNDFEKNRYYDLDVFENKIFCKVGTDILNYETGLYDIQQKKILWVCSSAINPLIVSGFMFSQINNKIERYEINSGTFIWCLSVLELGHYFKKSQKDWKDGEPDKLLGIYREILWVVLKNGLILGINVQTGEVLHKIGAPKKYPPELQMMEDTKEDNLFYNNYSIFDEKNGKIIRLWHAGYNDNDFDWYFEIDLNEATPQLKIYKVENTTATPFKIDGGPSPVWPFDDEYIYTCNYRDCKLALFNRTKKQIEWIGQMEMEQNPEAKFSRKALPHGFIKKMEVKDGRWYIVDSSNTMHIYERE